jgi:long-chain acyl-CoA synthetase
MTVTSAQIDEIVAGRTAATAFLETVKDHGSLTALRWKEEDDSWSEWTFDEYAAMVARAVTGLREKGVGPGDRMVLMMRNIASFHVLDMAAYFLGATSVSIYNSSSPEQVAYLAGDCGASIGIVEDAGFLERFLKVRDQLPALTELGILNDPDGSAPADVFKVDELLDCEAADLDEAATAARPEDVATLIYTSGTTGPPKGVIITHYNIAWTVESMKITLAHHPDFKTFAGKRLVSYLPMAHIAERMVSHYQQAFLGYEVTCCPDAGQIAAYFGSTKPNFIFGVPRVWEKLHAGVVAALAADPDKKKMFDDGIAAARPIVERLDWGTATDEDRATYEFLDEAGFAAVRALVGLDQCELAVTGAAPIPAELLSWYRALGVPLTEIYGMSESCGPMTWTAVKVKAGSVGPAIPGCEVLLADDGEIVCRGGNVFQGYLNNEGKTAEALDADGWLHSGDIGIVDDDAYFTIVDRKKELIITAGGKNISPSNLEAALKMIPLVGQACAIGDQRKFVSALVVLDPDVGPQWATSEGIDYDDLADLAETDEVRVAIEAGLREVMAEFNNAESVKKVHIIGEEWLPDSEVLTPTSKLKRRGINERYEAEIEALYD